jgi:hypothetical protein
MGRLGKDRSTAKVEGEIAVTALTGPCPADENEYKNGATPGSRLE